MRSKEVVDLDKKRLERMKDFYGDFPSKVVREDMIWLIGHGEQSLKNDKKNLDIQANMQKRIDYLLDALENIEVEICLSRNDSAEKALSFIRQVKKRNEKIRGELKI